MSIFYYSNIINENTYKFLKLFIVLISLFINSIILGKGSTNKGYIEGVKFGLIIILLILIPTIIWFNLELKLLLYYGMILGVTTLGSSYGKARKKTT